MNAGKPIPNRKNSIPMIAGGIAVVLLAIVCILMLLGPIIGNVFTTINGSLSGAGDHSLANNPMEKSLPQTASLEILPAPTERLIIRTGYLSLTVKDTLATQQEIEKIVKELAGDGAFIVSSNAGASSGGTSPNIETVIRVPSEKFDEVMDKLTGMAVNVNTRNETAQDVTEEYVDVAARIQSLEAARDRLLQIMQNSANTEDLLKAEQLLTQREAEIESLKGRMKYLSESAQLSSITIELSPYLLNQPRDNKWRPAETVRHATDALVSSLRIFAEFLIVFGIAVLPWLLAIGAIWWGVARIVRKRRSPKQEEAPKG